VGFVYYKTKSMPKQLWEQIYYFAVAMSSITFSLIQTNLHWENKAANLQMFEEKIFSIKEKTQVVLLPEMFSTGFSMRPEALAETMDGAGVQWLKRVAAKKKVIIGGSLIIEEDQKYFNRFIWMLPNGEYGYYDKRHLFAYADEDKHYTAGKVRKIASVNGWKINLQVCYDLRFPVWARQQFDKDYNFEYDVLVYVANWPERRSTAWKTLLRARAIENQCYVLGLNRVGTDGNNIYHSGDSMVIDPLGEILYEKKDDEDIFTIKLNRLTLTEIRNKFQFWRDADHFEIFT
ncbi:MAG TPA: amidohydrolase, partial [Flavisolibacter sp.]|nr:amidohydrolase [Flavisolibacter sp.]